MGRLAYYLPERFIAFGFLSVSPPESNANYKEALAMAEKLFGSPLFGYQEFFSSDDAAKIIEDHVHTYFVQQEPNVLFF